MSASGCFSGPKNSVRATTILSLADRPDCAKFVVDWLHREWGIDVDEISSLIQASDERPGAILAVEDDHPMGVLAYKRYHANFQLRPELWINAVYVLPDFRRNGVGRKLVIAGSMPRYVGDPKEIFVYTDVPALYLSCGWKLVVSDATTGMHTLRFPIVSR
ncbi:GNAT family N-acetyltransferase [Stieleria sp. TO1_6]|uniref:GNAT family N-acetyltransferase n=1 Tax=Stieleria tagensis TaxID=2956795 RepID=UPI00209B4E0F|nr:GNAT family N-acetyltransferase [Stieleria tagensis]MCO8123902.1 GNAT family N-acetyltransferase [Stieleria tagensis]